MKNYTEPQDASTAPGAKSHAIRIVGFVDGDVIPPACYSKPYRLEPGKKDGEAYDALRTVMHRTRKVGLAAVVIEKKQALAAIIPIGRTLVLNVLRLATGLVPGAKRAADAPQPAAKAPLAAVAPRRAPVPAEARPVARIASARKSGEVIDLAQRRSSKQRVARGAKRVRTGSVATLHELRRKAPGRNPVERQLA